MSNRHTIARIYEAFAKGDISFILDKLTDDVEWDFWIGENSAQKAGVPWLKPRRGKSDVSEFFKVVETMGIYKFEVLSIHKGEYKVTAEISIGCKYFDDEEIHLWTFNDNGKISQFRHYVDTAKHISAFEKR